MNKTVSILFVLLALGGVGYMLMKNSAPATVPSSAMPVVASPEVTEKIVVVNDEDIIVEGSPFKFAPNTITIKKGVLTKIVFKNLKGSHDFVVDGLGIRTKILKDGEEEVLEFTPEKTGSFEFYCSVGSHRAMGMKGTLIVE